LADADPATAPAGWSPAELATLAAIAETFVRGGAIRRAELFAAAVDAAADPAQVRELRLVLRLVESRWANALLARRPTAFRDLSAADRERYLQGWAASPIALRRTAFHGLRKLLTFLAYAGSEAAPNPLHAAIGFEPDRPPLTDLPSPIRAWPLPPPGAAGDTIVEADVVVVGSGAGGGVAARDLALAGRSVVVLEAGALVDESSMPMHELEAFDRLYLNHGLTATWDGSVTLLAGGAVGGGTLVNWMTSLDSPPELRREWARDHGIDGWDGAESLADVAALEAELGVAPIADVAPKDALILRGAAELGWSAQPLRRNGAGCADCGSCGFGCRRGAKQSGIRTHLAEAWRAGARIVPDASVDRVVVEHDAAAGVAAVVRQADGTSRRVTFAARQVVVAAGALGTPGILERSGLAHPAIGRHLRVHPVPVLAGILDEPVEMWRGVMQGAAVREFVTAEPGRRPYVIESAPGSPGLLALGLPWEGTDAHAALMARASFVAPLLAVVRDGGEGRVSSTRHGRTRLDYRLDRDGVATLRHALVSMARVARAGGAREIVAVGTRPRWFGRGGRSAGSDAAFGVFLDALAAFDFRPNRGTVMSAHQMGTARMAAGHAAGVCDPCGRVRRSASDDAVVRGLYVADGSLFPTGLGVNPMLTIMALARRVGRTVLAEG
jgi:choline dehydrogenase-like flavoprotein